MQTFIRLIINIGALILKGYVLQKLWIWFVFGTFTTIQLSLPIAIGLLVIISKLKFSTGNIVSALQDLKQETDKDKNTREWAIAAVNLLLPLIVLLEGWVVTLFM